MPIEITRGDLLAQDVEAIVNTVNTVGVMGKGIAYQFKKKWSENCKAYEKACKAGDVRVGKMFVHELGRLSGVRPYFIINFPTKAHWRSPSKLSYIEEGLQDLVRVIRDYQIRSIALPPLGCGNGGLDWNIVKPIIIEALKPLEQIVQIKLFETGNAPSSQHLVTKTEKPSLTLPRAALIVILNLYKQLGYSLTKVEIQKLAYFGFQLNLLPKLNYNKNQYGPYAHNLNHVLSAIEGHYIQGIGDHDTIHPDIEVIPHGLQEAQTLLHQTPECWEKIERIERLIEGFETPLGMELLATVHWVATQSPFAKRVEDAVDAIHNWDAEYPEWGERKKILMPTQHIATAWERLQSERWV
jgi:O-acetyl-ADP-ribose deacetylase (regulator of RNase III)